MKTFILIGLLAVVTPTPTPFDASKVDFSKISDADMEATKAHRNVLQGQLDAHLDTIATVASDAQLGATNANLKVVTGKTIVAFGQFKEVTAAEIAKGNAAILQLNAVLVKYHKLKWILCGLWAGLVALIVGVVIMKLPLPLKAYSLYIILAGVALTGVGSTLIWTLL